METTPLVPSTPTRAAKQLESETSSDQYFEKLRPVFTPFIHQYPHYSIYETVKVVIFSVTVFPIRFITSLVILVSLWIALLPATLFNTQRRLVKLYIRLFATILLKTLLAVNGFVFFKRLYDPSPENPGKHRRRGKRRVVNATIVVNHVSWVDIVYFAGEIFPSFIAKAEVSRIPFIGKIAKSANCLFVNRSDPNSRQLISSSMNERMSDESKSSLLIFPQGCTSDSSHITQFQLGAFRPAKPVQPVVLCYEYKRGNPSWDTAHFLYVFWRCACQFYNKVSVLYLPLYHPSEEEQANPRLFADNVRHEMAKAGGLRAVESGYREKRIYEEVLFGKISSREANSILEIERQARVV
ncbi:hypothetical protein P9112_000826 [Eukaryota sp. TZLM1-RC]